MAIIRGPRALIDNALPAGIDASYILNFAMQEEMTPQEVITMAADTIGQANEYLAAMYGGLIYFTEKTHGRYRQGTGERRMTPKGSEYAEEDGYITDKVGHMLFIDDYKDATPWSRDYLERAIREDLADDITTKRDDWINRIDYDVFTRLFSNTYTPVGTAGYSAPWVISDSGTTLPYIPPQWMSNTFDSTHSHFIRVNAAISEANIISTAEAMAAHLSEHGFLGMKLMYVGSAAAAILIASNSPKVARFIPKEFRLLSGNTNAPIASIEGQLEGVPGEIVCYITTPDGLIEVRKHARVPAGYLWMGKSAGNNNPNNPLAIRLYKGKGFGLNVNPQVDRSMVPTLDKILFKGTHGVNVNDRLAGVAAQIASGGTTYQQPTIV